MNRATKRLLAKQEKQAERERARSMPLPGGAGGAGGPGRPPTANGGASGGGFGRRRGSSTPGAVKEKRLKRWAKFLREVRAELKKVAWPSRNEVTTYTIVVLVSVTFVTLLVFVLDFGFGKAVFQLFK
jgi:preprotein translocase subunit SecE